MILELAALNVIPGQEEAFEEAFSRAKTIINQMPGFCGLELQKSIAAPNEYVLLVRWGKVTDHTDGFRKSPEYRLWSQLLHHFYDPFPIVRYFQCVASASAKATDS